MTSEPNLEYICCGYVGRCPKCSRTMSHFANDVDAFYGCPSGHRTEIAGDSQPALFDVTAAKPAGALF